MTPLLQSQPVSVVVGLCLVAFLCVRQLRAQEVSETRGLRLMVVFGVLGAAQLMTALDADPVSTVALACVLASLMIEGALGGLRGARVAIYREGSQLMSGGNATTVALWIAGVAVHFGTEAFASLIDTASAGISGASLVIGVVLSLGAQKYVTLDRAKRCENQPPDAG
jgi:hypothetical protein